MGKDAWIPSLARPGKNANSFIPWSELSLIDLLSIILPWFRLIFLHQMRRFHPKSLQYFSLEHMKRKCLFLLKLSSQIIQSAVFSNADVAGNLARQKSVLMQGLPR